MPRVCGWACPGCECIAIAGALEERVHVVRVLLETLVLCHAATLGVALRMLKVCRRV